MIGETIALISLFVVMGITLLKMVNVMKMGSYYPKEYFLLTMGAVLFFFGLYYATYFTFIGYETTIIEDGNLYVIKDTTFLFLDSYALFINIGLFLSGFFTMIEMIYFVYQQIVPATRGRTSKKSAY